MDSAKQFYVYELRDPRCGSVFYVGKGQRNRMHAHVAEAMKGVQGKKCDRIRSVMNDGLAVQAVKIKSFAKEADALDFEEDRIAEIGLQNLTNIMPRGSLMNGDRMQAIHKAIGIAGCYRIWIKGGSPKYLVFPGGKLDLEEIVEKWKVALWKCCEVAGTERIMQAMAKRGVKLEVPVRENG